MDISFRNVWLTVANGRDVLATAAVMGIAFPVKTPEALAAAASRRLPTRFPAYEKKKFFASCPKEICGYQ